MSLAQVFDARGQQLSPCSAEKAQRLVESGEAELVNNNPLVIRLRREITKTSTSSREVPCYKGERLLLHICCGPCATYTTHHLRTAGWEVTGFWYNPNIEPKLEYQKRQQSLDKFTKYVALPMVWEMTAGSEAFREVVGEHTRLGERCAACYRLRLRRTAQIASRLGIGTISTSLLISPYQNLEMLHEIGAQEARSCGLTFYYENMRSGYHARTQYAVQYGLYLQTYCGCAFSEQEAKERRAHPRAMEQLSVSRGKAC